MNQVTFTIQAVTANADTIAKMTALAMGASTGPVMQTKGNAKPAKTDKPAATDTDDVVTLAQFKKAAGATKKEHGEEFAMLVIEEFGVKVGTTLGRTVSKVDADAYQSIMDSWTVGPAVKTDDDDDGLGDDLDDDGLGDDEPEVDAEAVKVALKAYSKDTGRAEAKELMAEFKCKSLADVDKLKPAQLAELLERTV